MTGARRGGFALLPVVMLVGVLAAIAFLITHDGAMSTELLRSAADADEAGYVADAGLSHALWQLDDSACGGDLTLASAGFGAHSYSATVTAGGATTASSLSVDQDAWIRNDLPTTNNGGNADQHIRFGSGNVEQVLTRFNLSSLAPGAQINSAVAWFYVKSNGAHPEGPLSVHRVTADWTEGGVTWDSFAGSFDSAVLATIPAQTQGDVWVQINLTSQVQAWVNGEPNFGVLLASSSEGTHAHYISREGASGQQPRLDVVVGTAPASPVNIQVTGTLDNGVTRTLSRLNDAAYQPPGSVSLQLGTDPGADAMLDSFYPRNYGGRDFVQLNGAPSWLQRPLLRFDLGRVPARAAVLSARLELRMRSLVAPGTATVHRVTRSWVEGTQSGTGQPDGATWATYDGTNNWTSTGGDFNASAVAETTIDSSDTWVTWEVASLVEQWLAGEPNDGLLIQADGALREAEFFTQEDADATVHPKLTITYACECGSACLTPQGSGNVLMVIGSSPANPAPEDQSIRDHLESWGFSVSLIQDDDSQGNFDAGAAANDVVYISESVASGNVGTKLTNASIGVVSAEGLLNDELGISTNRTSPVTDTIDVVDSSHYITWVFPAAPLRFKTAPTQLQAVGGTLAPGAQVLAQIGGVGSVVALDTGVALAAGGSAAGRRVLVPVGEATVDWRYLTGNGRLLVQRALQWAAGLVGAGSSPIVLSTDSAATLGGLSFSDIDLVEYDPSTDTASLFFDGSLTTLNVDITAVHVLANGHLVLSPKDNATLGGLSFAAGDLADYDPVADTATLVFDGSALFLDPTEKVVSVHVLDNGHFVLSTDSAATLGGLSFSDRDLAEYDPSTDTASLFFDGSLTTLDSAISAVHVLANGHIVLSPKDAATLGGLSFAAGDLADYDPVADAATLIFDGSTLFTDPTEKVVSAHVGPGSGSIDLSCDADYTPDSIVFEFSTAGYPQRLNRGVTYFPEGQVLGGVVSTAGGAWIAVGGSGILWMVGMDGSQLDGGYATGLSQLEGIAFVPAAVSSDPGHLAIVKGSTLYYSDMTLPANGSYTTHPLPFATSAGGVTYIDGGSYDGHLAVADKGSGQVHIIDQSFDLVTTLATGGLLSAPEGIAHLKDTDKFLVVDTGLHRGLIFDADLAVSQDYDLVPFGLGGATGAAAAIHPDSCDHVFGDRPNNRYAYLNTGGGGGGGGGGGPSGPGYVEAHQTWSASSSDSWETVDLSGYGVPADAVVEVAVTNASTSNQRWGGVRAVGSSLDRRLQLHEAESGGVDAVVMHAQADASGRIEHYSDATGDVSFMLLGYWTGAVYEERFDTFAAGASGSWHQRQLGAYGVGPGQVAEIVIANTSTSSENYGGLQPVGADLERRLELHEAESGGVDAVTLMVTAGDDDGASVELYAESNADIEFHLLGTWSTPPGDYVEGVGKYLGAATAGAWEPADLGLLGVPAGAVAQLVMANLRDSAEVEQGQRATGSSQTRTLDLHEAESGGADLVSLHVNVDESSQIEWFSEYQGVDQRFYPTGWWVLYAP